jgi:hypothetical protein
LPEHFPRALQNGCGGRLDGVNMKPRSWWCPLLFALALAGCRSVAPEPQPAVPEGGLGLTLIDDGCAGKEWIGTPPASGEGPLWFAGISRRHAEEQDAWDEAEIHATNQFVRYTGVSVSIVAEHLKVSVATASEIRDPTLSEREVQRRLAKAFVSRVKVAERCIRRYGDLRPEGPRVAAYFSAVLVRVPASEYDAVLQRARDKRNALLGEAERAFNDARAAEQRALVVPALVGLQAARRALEEAQATHAPGPWPGGAPSETAIRGQEDGIVAAIALTPGAGARQRIEPGDTPAALALEASYRREGRSLPLPSFPVAFVRKDGMMRTRTDESGVALLHVPSITVTGRFTFWGGVDTSSMTGSRPDGVASPPPADGSPAQVAPHVLSALGAMRVPFEIEVAHKTPAEKAAELLTALGAKLERESYKVVIGNFVYEDAENTDTAGRFSSRFADLVETRVASGGRLQRIERGSLRGQTRSVGDPPSRSPSALARAAQADAVLYGKYYAEGESVVVKARLDDLDARLLAAAVVRIHRSVIPDEWTLTPPNYDRQKADVAALQSSGDFDLDLWIDKGNGAVYREGEKLYVNVRAGVDCYLKLVYLDAAGNAVVIFPNAFQRDTRIRGGRVVQIPDDRARFDFQIQPPFGAEALAAFASTEPFPADAGREVGNGMVLLTESISVIARRNRGMGVVGRRSEARVTLTTMQR